MSDERDRDGESAKPTEPVETGTDHAKPLQSWTVMSDQTTSINLEIWSNMIQGPIGTIEQLSCTLTRSYKDGEGNWQKGGSWRINDIPVLMFLLHKAHGYAMDRRLD